MMMGELYTEVSVVFENVRFQRATNIPKDGNLEFIVMIQKGSGQFEVSLANFFRSREKILINNSKKKIM